MALVKVWNDNVHDFKQKFRGDDIHVPAKAFIWMEADVANLFRGAYSPIKRDSDGQPLPTSYKMIRIEEVTAEQKAAEAKLHDSKCNACGFQASSKTDLDEHVNASHLNQMLDQEEATKRRNKKAS